MAEINLLLVLSLLSFGPEVRVLRRGAVVIDRVPKLPAHASVRPDPAAVDSGFAWQLQGSFSNSVFTDLSFADDSFGYASAELGIVYRTTDGGRTWSRIMNLGFPYYWYGVHAVTRRQVIVTGFNNSAGSGIYRWTFDAGATWDSIVNLDPSHWFGAVQFADTLHGIIAAAWNGGIWRTENGGRNPADWEYVQIDPARGWYAGSFAFLPNLHSYITGITFCHSRDAGQDWDVRSSIDPVFDGGLAFPDTLCGWTGGGQISDPVSGWIHRTTDAGQTWSDRLIETPEPIRSLLFINDTLGFAVGGNLYSGVGAIYSTVDGGLTWYQDINTHAEMKGIDCAQSGDSIDVWCAGFNSGFTGFIYKTRLGFPSSAIAETPACLNGRATNARLTRRWLSISAPGSGPAVLYGITGHIARRWTDCPAQLDLAGLPSGCYVLRIGTPASDLTPVVLIP